MKIAFKTLLIFFLFCFTISSTNAATVTWLGANSSWDDPSQWDTGYVPNAGDDVVIPSGRCKIYSGDFGYVRSVDVQSSGRLYVYEGGHLEISGAVDDHGLHNMGRVYIYGELAINDITQTNTANSANAIRNDYRIYTYSNCVINIKYIDDVAIENTSTNSYFRVRGNMWIYGTKSAAIYNFDRFYNYGQIDIVDCGVSSGYLILNTDNFRNYSSGVINLSSDIYGGISTVSTATLRNYGAINIEEVKVAINNEGLFMNYAGGKIYADDSDISYYNREVGTIYNYGKMSSTDSDHGLFNYGSLHNHDSFTVFYSHGNGSIRNFPTGTINNHDYIYLLSNQWIDLYNEGIITNQNSGHLAINKSITLTTGSNITNNGFFISYGDVFHSLNGDFENNGVIDDDFGALVGLIDNNKVVVAPVTGTMQVGVPFPNILDAASLNDLDIDTWKISMNGASAGTYNETTNEFTPNASAVGVSTLYISIYNLISGKGRNFTLELDSPIVSFQKKGKASTRNIVSNENNLSQAINIYPNPTPGNIQLNSRTFENLDAQVQILNSLGQVVQQEKFTKGSNTQSIEISDQLIDGMYFVRTIQEGKEINVQKIQVNR